MREMPSSLLERWRAFYRMDPFGDDWLQAATIAAATMNPHIKKSVPVREFIPNYKPDDSMSDDEITGTLNSIVQSFAMIG